MSYLRIFSIWTLFGYIVCKYYFSYLILCISFCRLFYLLWRCFLVLYIPLICFNFCCLHFWDHTRKLIARWRRFSPILSSSRFLVYFCSVFWKSLRKLCLNSSLVFVRIYQWNHCPGNMSFREMKILFHGWQWRQPFLFPTKEKNAWYNKNCLLM